MTSKGVERMKKIKIKCRECDGEHCFIETITNQNTGEQGLRIHCYDCNFKKFIALLKKETIK